MKMGDSITSFDVGARGCRALQDAGIFNWCQAKNALEKGTIHGIKGVGAKTIEAIKAAKPRYR